MEVSQTLGPLDQNTKAAAAFRSQFQKLHHEDEQPNLLKRETDIKVKQGLHIWDRKIQIKPGTSYARKQESTHILS